MQPSQPPHSGLSTTICGPGLIWPAGSAYGAYGQSFPTSFNPMATVSSQFASATDTSALNPGALLAVAAALHQQQQPQITCAQKPTVTNTNSETSTPVTQTSSTIASLLTTSAKTPENCQFTTASTLLTEPWYPSKRIARSSDYPTEKCSDSEPSDIISARNGTNGSGAEEVKCEADLTPFCGETSSLLPPGLALPSYCGAFSNQDVASGFSNMINPVNLYGIAFPTHPAVVSSYLPAPYPSIYATQGATEATNPATMIAFNNWLTQQQPHHIQSTAQHFLPTQVPLIPAANSNNTLAVLAGLQQNAQPSSPDLPGTAQPLSLALQNQQAALLSLIIRAQQSQWAAAQMAAAVQASGTNGLLQNGSSPRAPVLGTLQNQCLLDPTYSLQTLAGLCPTHILPAMPYVQNPTPKMDYVYDNGRHGNSLMVCRDFKAGKCHRNNHCRYVHLVDENIEVIQGRVTVCRDATKGRCTRMPCKYYHAPVQPISTDRSLALNAALATYGVPLNQ